MEPLDESHHATLVDPIWRLRGAVIAERRQVAATLTDGLQAVTRKSPRTPPAPPPKPQPRQVETEADDDSDPLQELAQAKR